jgi:hypothetical protein
MTRYNVKTYDWEIGEFTPQEGLRNPSFNLDIYGLRRCLRELRDECGYPCNRVRDGDSDPSVLVESFTLAEV